MIISKDKFINRISFFKPKKMKLIIQNLRNMVFSPESSKRRFLEVYGINARDRPSEINKIIDSRHLSEDRINITMVFA